MRMFPARPVAQIIRFGVGNREVLFAAADAVVAEAGGQNPGRLGSGFGDTVDFDHIKRHYYQVHADINPSRTVSPGPDLSGWLTPHGRDALGRCPSATAPRPDPHHQRRRSRWQYSRLKAS